MVPGFFGRAKQNGYVVHDLDAAVEHWTKRLGVGPFFRKDHIDLEHYEFEGRACDVDMSVALSYMGELQIELIQQHNNAPSHYQSFLRKHGPGLHHVLIANDKPLDENLEHMSKLGFTPTSTGKVRNGSRFVYFDLGGHTGSTLEMGDGSPRTLAYFDRIRLHVENWDGRDPVRSPAAAAEEPAAK